MPFENGLMFIETERPVYYPGQTIEGNVHLLVTKAIMQDARTLDIRVRGKESFNFKNLKRREEESCRNYF